MIESRWKRWGLMVLWIIMLPALLLLLLATRLSPDFRRKVESALAG